MKATEKNEKIARDIINLLAENNCTVKESTEILRWISDAVQITAPVQKETEKLFEVPFED